MKRLMLAACLAALSLAAVASPATSSVTIGQIGTPTGGTSGFDDIQLSVPSGNSYVVPGNGRITSWRTYAGPGGGQTMSMKIFRKVLDPFLYMVVGHSGPHPLLPGQLSSNTFPADIPVKPGDLLGVGTPAGSTASYLIQGGTGDYLYRDNGLQPGGLGDGQDGTFNPDSGVRFNIEAVFEPTNSFTSGKIRNNKKKGTATLTVDVPNPGELSGSGKGVKAAAAGATISKAVTPGAAQLLIKAKGKKKRKLNETGKVKLNVAITYTPTGGDPSTQSVKVKLKKR